MSEGEGRTVSELVPLFSREVIEGRFFSVVDITHSVNCGNFVDVTRNQRSYASENVIYRAARIGIFLLVFAWLSTSLKTSFLGCVN